MVFVIFYLFCNITFQSTGQYLTDGETTDAESVLTDKSLTGSERSSNYGTLKHSDSLLLLTQVNPGKD